MRSNRAAHWLKWGCLVCAVLAAAALPAPARAGEGADDSPQARRVYLKELPNDQKAQLLRKKERFDALPPDEQERLRQLHDALSQRPDAEQLRQTIQRYDQWLKTLTSTQRAELQRMSSERRLPQIKRLMVQQERTLLERLAKGEALPTEDLNAILDWLAEFIEAHEKEILAALPERIRGFYRIPPNSSEGRSSGRTWDPKRRRYFLYGQHLWYGNQSNDPAAKEKIIQPDEDDIEALESRLSDTTRKMLDSARPQKRMALVQEWIGAAMLSKTRRPPSDRDLRDFFERHVKDLRQREELESLPPQKMRDKLLSLYYNHMKESRESSTRRSPSGSGSGPRTRRGDFRGPSRGSGGSRREFSSREGGSRGGRPPQRSDEQDPD